MRYFFGLHRYLCLGLFVFTSLLISSVSAQPSVDEAASKKIENAQSSIKKSVRKELLENRLSNISSNIDGAATLIDSFLTDIEIASLFDGIDGDDKTPISFSHNFSAFGAAEKNSKLQFILNTNAQVSKDISTALGADLTTKLQEGVDDFDDIEIAYSLDVNRGKIGKWGKAWDDLFTQISRDFVTNEDIVVGRKQILDSLRDIDELPNVDAYYRSNGSLDIENPDCEKFLNGMREVNPGRDMSQAGTMCEALVAASVARQKAAIKLTKIKQPYALAEMVKNQPRLQVSAKYFKRADAIGADELSIKASYSFGRGMNLNRLVRMAKDDGDAQNNNGLLDAYYRYAQCAYSELPEDDGSPRNCGQGGSFSVALEYSDIDDQIFNFSGVDFSKKGGSKVTGSIGYDRTLAWIGREPVFDLAAKLEFEEFSSDTKGNDRVLATVTLTRKINDRLSIPFSIQYANKSEFLEDPDSQVTANLGIKYDINFTE